MAKASGTGLLVKDGDGGLVSQHVLLLSTDDKLGLPLSIAFN